MVIVTKIPQCWVGYYTLAEVGYFRKMFGMAILFCLIYSCSHCSAPTPQVMQVYRFGDPLNEASEVFTQSILLGLKLSGLVIIVTAVIYAVERYSRNEDGFTEEMDWHDALYFTVVTLSTVSP